VRITGNEIIDSVTAGLRLENSFNAIVSDNIINNNGNEGILVDNSSGTIGSSTVMDNKTDGIVINNSSPTLVDNIITSNARDGIAIRGFVSLAAPLLRSNVVRDNGGVSNYDIICFGANTNPTGAGNTFDRCINCAECGNFDNPITFE
jgi:parallel beta-helix repeat protein